KGGAVERRRHTGLEADHDLRRRRGPTERRAGQEPDVAGSLGPGVLDGTALDGPAPQVLVDGVRALLALFDRDAVLGGVVHGRLAGEAPVPRRGEDLEVGGQRPGRHLEADLVVPLAGATVGDSGRTVAAGGGHELLDDD